MSTIDAFASTHTDHAVLSQAAYPNRSATITAMSREFALESLADPRDEDLKYVFDETNKPLEELVAEAAAKSFAGHSFESVTIDPRAIRQGIFLSVPGNGMRDTLPSTENCRFRFA